MGTRETQVPPSHNRARVVVIGSYAKALVVTADRIPLEGETLIGTDYRQTYGGKGSDMAVQSARLGATTEYLGVIGDDLFGHEFQELMVAEGVGIGRSEEHTSELQSRGQRVWRLL